MALSSLVHTIPFAALVLENDKTIKGFNTKAAHLLGKKTLTKWRDVLASEQEGLVEDFFAHKTSSEHLYLPITIHDVAYELLLSSPVKNTSLGIILPKQFTSADSSSEQLQKSFRHLAIILEGVADGITVHDGQNNLLYANSAAAKLSGFPTKEAFINTPVPHILDKYAIFDELGNPFPLTQLPGRQVMNGKTYAESIVAFRNKRTKHMRYMHIKATAAFDTKKNVQFAVNILHDITDVKKREKQREIFLGVASHEIKSLLASVKAYTQLLTRRFQKHLDLQVVNYLFRMDKQVDSLIGLMTNLLDITRIRSGKFASHKEFFDTKTMIHDMVETVQVTTKTHTITVTNNPSVLLYGDKVQLGRVLINLLTNAIKYAPNTKEIIVCAQQKNNMMEISVRDFGPGIPKKLHKKIFTLFYQDDLHTPKTEGLGLGLAIAKAIVQNHKGKIWVESEKPKGTTFLFTLPLPFTPTK